MRANALRLFSSSIAYMLLAELRRIGLAATDPAHLQAGTLWVRILKIAAVVRVSVRRAGIT